MLDFDSVRALTFDCYGTLINWEAGILMALRPTLAHRGIEVSGDDLLEAYGEIEAQLESGPWKPYRQVLRECVAGLGLRYNFSPTALEMDALPSSLAFWPAFPDTLLARGWREGGASAFASDPDFDLVFRLSAFDSRLYLRPVTPYPVPSTQHPTQWHDDPFARWPDFSLPSLPPTLSPAAPPLRALRSAALRRG
jgi:hypothetical protein